MSKFKITLLVLLLTPMFAFSKSATQVSGIPDLILLVLLSCFILLLIGIAYALAKSIEAVSKSPKVKKEDKAKETKVLGLLALVFFSFPSHAATAIDHSAPTYTMSNVEFWLLISTIFVLFIVIGIFFRVLQTLVKINNGESFETEEPKDLLQTLNLVDNVPIEDEVEIMLDHEYDGIRELDNNLPPWWKYGFYLTIIVSCIYLFRFHISGTGKLQAEEYDIAMETAKLEKEKMMASTSESITEENVSYLIDAPTLSKGAAIYKGNCATCHGQLGEGGAGPNLTDEYWIHGGGIKNVFKTIKYGVPAKGMIAWQSQFSPSQMQVIASYVLSLQGSNPPNGKSPQGEKYTEEEVLEQDISNTTVDSTAIINVGK